MQLAPMLVNLRSFMAVLCALFLAISASAEDGSLFVPKRAARESQEQPTMSGDGLRIAYISRVTPHQQSQDAVMLFDRRTQEHTEVSAGLDGYYYAPSVSRDGSSVLFRNIPRGSDEAEALYLFQVDSRTLERVVIPPSLGIPALANMVDGAISSTGRFVVARVLWSVDDGESETFFERIVWIDRKLSLGRVLAPASTSSEPWLTLLGATSDQEYFAISVIDPSVDPNTSVILAARFDNPVLVPAQGESPVRSLDSLLVRTDRAHSGNLTVAPFSSVGETFSSNDRRWSRTLLGRIGLETKGLSSDGRYLYFRWAAPFRSALVSSAVRDARFQEMSAVGHSIGLLDVETGEAFEFRPFRSDGERSFAEPPATDASGQTIAVSEETSDGARQIRLIIRQAFHTVPCSCLGSCFEPTARMSAPRVIREYEYRVADSYALLPIRPGMSAEVEVQYLESLDPSYVSEEASCSEFTTARTLTAVVTRKRVRSNVVRLPRPRYLCQQYADGNDRYRVRFRVLPKGGAKPTAWSSWTEFLGTFYWNPV